MWNSLVRVRMKIAKTGVIFHFSMIHVGYFIKTSVGSPLPPTSDTVASFVLFVSFYFSHHYHQYKCENGGGVFKWELENECSVQGHSHSKHPTTFNWPKHGAYVTPIMHMAGAQAQYTSKPPFQVCAQTQEINEYSFFFFQLQTHSAVYLQTRGHFLTSCPLPPPWTENRSWPQWNEKGEKPPFPIGGVGTGHLCTFWRLAHVLSVTHWEGRCLGQVKTEGNLFLNYQWFRGFHLGIWSFCSSRQQEYCKSLGYLTVFPTVQRREIGDAKQNTNRIN